MNGVKILFVVPYPTGKAPSQRFRFEQYYNLLNAKGYRFDCVPFLTDEIWGILYQPGRFLLKASGILKGIFRRILLLFKLREYDFLFIHREACPVGLPFFEFTAARILRKKIIYDFDDAIWIPNYSEANSFFSFLKGYGNVKHICGYSWKVSCGNQYLCNFAENYAPRVVYNPTTIDTENYHNRVKDQQGDEFVIGWTGSHSTIRYISEIIPVLQELETTHRFVFKVISDIQPEFELKSLVFKKWEKDAEIDDLLTFNVGIMPLVNDKWANGKCGFKALQYMALGIPALVSPVGVNSQIVDHGVNGFICATPLEWKSHLLELMNNRSLLRNMGNETRRKIEEKYSVRSNGANFLSLFELRQ